MLQVPRGTRRPSVSGDWEKMLASIREQSVLSIAFKVGQVVPGFTRARKLRNRGLRRVGHRCLRFREPLSLSRQEQQRPSNPRNLVPPRGRNIHPPNRFLRKSIEDRSNSSSQPRVSRRLRIDARIALHVSPGERRCFGAVETLALRSFPRNARK